MQCVVLGAIGQRLQFDGLLPFIHGDGGFPAWRLLEIFDVDLRQPNLCATDPA
jgi:hypothetical protein